MRAARRRPPWLFLSVLAMGAAVAVGGFVTYADQSSGTPGKAKVSECTGGRKYQPAIRCRGTWVTGGALVGGDGRVVVGQVEGPDTATSARRSTCASTGPTTRPSPR